MSTQPASPTTPTSDLDVEVAREQLLTDWLAAVRDRTPAADCPDPGCPGKVRALPPVETPGVLWLEGECDECGREVAFPNGRRKPSARPGPLASVRRFALRAAGADGERLPDWCERAAGPDR